MIRYDLDLPEIIELRKRYIKADERAVQISKSCFDYSWMDVIRYDKRKGLLFIVGGVFYYFNDEQVRGFINRISESFPGARMIFDVTSKAGLRISNRYVRKTGNTGAEMFFSLNNAKRFFSDPDSGIKVIEEYPFYSRIKKSGRWNSDTRFRMWFSDSLNMVKLVGIEFH